LCPLVRFDSPSHTYLSRPFLVLIRRRGGCATPPLSCLYSYDPGIKKLNPTSKIFHVVCLMAAHHWAVNLKTLTHRQIKQNVTPRAQRAPPLAVVVILGGGPVGDRAGEGGAGPDEGAASPHPRPGGSPATRVPNQKEGFKKSVQGRGTVTPRAGYFFQVRDPPGGGAGLL